MHDRYRAPHAEATFHPDATISLWAEVTRLYAADLDPSLADSLAGIAVPTAMAVRTAELTYGHEVVAFLSLYTMKMSDEQKRHIHVGLTSSDLVDYALFKQVREHARWMSGQIRFLRELLYQSGRTAGARAGRTHGQLAAPTSWNWQMKVIGTTINDLANEINAYANDHVFKSPGPTGRSDRSTRFLTMGQAKSWIAPSTQVLPRDHLLRWGALYLRLACQLENLALQVRLASRADVREVREGGTDERVGSSSMPTKQNPISSEKVCGLARIVRGQFLALSEEVALWEDRDLTNSSTERVTVPDMAATVEHMLTTMQTVIDHLVINEAPMHRRTANATVWTHAAQSLLQTEVGIGPVEAGNLLRDLGALGDLQRQNWHYLRQIVWNQVRQEFGTDAAERWQRAFTDAVMSIREGS